MTNHVHLVAVAEREDAFARALQRCHSRWAQRFNRQYSRSGHLWQGRFFSCALDRDHLVTALAYVDLNPAPAGMVRDALAYPWSSARTHVEGRDGSGLLDLDLWCQLRGHERWVEMLARPPKGARHICVGSVERRKRVSNNSPGREPRESWVVAPIPQPTGMPGRASTARPGIPVGLMNALFPVPGVFTPGCYLGRAYGAVGFQAA